MRNATLLTLSISILFLLTIDLKAQSCEGGTSYSWDDDISVIIAPCSGCHGGTSGLFLNSYAGIEAGGNQCGTDNLLTGNTLINIITSTNTVCSGGTINNAMNSNCGGCIDGSGLSAIADWIADGAPEVCAILPVTYTEILGHQKDRSILLEWGTAVEINSQSFDIYHSTDLNRFDHLGSLDAAGNSSSEKNYSFEHTTPTMGDNYYRIVQTDFDGTENVSKHIVVRFTGDQGPNYIQLYPNPTADECHIVLDYPMKKDMVINVVDILGNVIIKKIVSEDSDSRMFNLQSQNFLTGTYVVQVIVQDDILFSQRLIKTH